MTTKAKGFPTYSIKGKTVEYKTVSFRVKTVDQDQGLVTGIASKFSNVDRGKDMVEPGAYTKTLQEGKAAMQSGRRCMYATLWMHQPEQPTGGVIDGTELADGLEVAMQYDITTNAAGIPNNPIATMVFSGFKQGYIDELSIGYIPIKYDYDKQGVRHLREIQLVEISAVTMNFAMNPEALVPASGVKSMNSVHTKGASGKTTWPLADRDTKWDGGEATKDIEAWADGDWSKVAQCFFWVAKSPPETLDDCKLPFVAKVGDEMQAIPAGIIACTGSHGIQSADIPDGDMAAVKAKIATYYKKMKMTPPWEDDDSDKRRRSMLNRKDFNSVHQAGKAADCLEDWGDLINDLTTTMIQIFGMGDTPQSDMDDCMTQFVQAVTDEWLPKAQESQLGQYLNDQGYCNDSTYVPYSLRVGSSGGYGWMSRNDQADQKVGRAISAATQSAIEQHQDEMKAMIDEHQKAMAASCKAMQAKVSDLTQLWQDEGQGPAYSDDKDDNGKSRLNDQRREPPQALTRQKANVPANRQQPPNSTALNDLTLADLEQLLGV